MNSPRVVHARVARRYTAAATKVFDAWLDPLLLGRWMFGPAVRDEEILRLDNDARAGGRFSFAVRRQGHEIEHVGEYVEMIRPRRLAFTWAIREQLPDNSLVTIDILSYETGCELSLNHELHPDWSAYLDRTEAAWSKMLDALAVAVKS
jgi:uncharacterized protein YndB with AHSA1/START domain